MEAIIPFSVSPNGDYALYSSPDGVLKLWETDTSVLRQEYTPSAHLSATCTCLAWGSIRHKSDTPKKKKKRRSGGEEYPEKCGDVVAIGTSAGDILLYNTRLGDIQTQLSNGHSDRINGLSWQSEDQSLFSCSNDHHIVHWDVSKNTVKHKWKAGDGSIHSVCVCSQHHVLSASRTIKLWNTQTFTLLKQFSGHATEVFQLLPIPITTSNTDSNFYFLSGAVNDRIVNAWHLDTSTNKTAVAAFSLPDEAMMLDLSKSMLHNQKMLLTVVTRAGQLVVFEHRLNGKLRQPVKPKLTIQVATPGEKEGVPRPIPILAAHLCDNNQILLVYGNFLKPTFEKIPYRDTESDMCLIREDTTRVSLKVSESTISKIKRPDVSKDATVLIPELMAPSAPSHGSRRKRKTSTSEMTIGQRLNVMNMGATKGSQVGKSPPSVNALTKLLTQGLQSKDKKIINNVLHQNDTVMENTVRRLPVQYIIPLLQYLTVAMQGRAGGGLVFVKWIKTILTVHTSYLMTFPEVVETFSSLYQMMDSRAAVYGRLSKLQGKLDLILSQITSQERHEEEALTDQQPLLMYQEESSDDEAALEDMVNSQTDSDDNLDLFDLDNEETAGEEGVMETDS